MIVAEIETPLVQTVIPTWEQAFDEPLTDKLKQVVRVLRIVAVENYIAPPLLRRGPKGHDRRLIARAFVIKALYNAPTTQHLIEMLHTQPMLRRLCGWHKRTEVPSSPTFSRAFAAFAALNLGEKVHQALVSTYSGARRVGHLCRDSTEILAREKAKKKERPKPTVKRKRGRPKKGEEPVPAPPSRLELQRTQDAATAFTELPTACDFGCKRDTSGYGHYWKGYKTHIDTADGGLPVTVFTTSASLHDSQAAIPMARRSAQRVISLYDLMDSAYDAAEITAVSEELGHRPLIDKNGRGKEVPPFDPATARRYRQRSISERMNARLKDEFGGRHVRVRGHDKVHLHIMFGILVLFADQLFQILRWD